MTAPQLIYFGFTALLVVVLAGIMIYLFRGKRKERVERPKYRMLEEDDNDERQYPKSEVTNSKSCQNGN